MISTAMVGLGLMIAAAASSNDQAPAAVTGNQQQLCKGLVGHWKLDEPAGDRATDSSGNGLTGTLINGPKRVAGVLGSALQLNGANQSIAIPHSAKLKPSRQITISAWVLPSNLAGARVIYRKEDGDQRHLFAFHENGAVLAFGLCLDGAYKELSASLPATKLANERWHLATAVYDGAAKRVYWDGVEIGSEPVSGKIATEGTAPGYVGSFAGQFECFDGCISDVRFYDRALNAGEIKQLYAVAAPRVEAGVAAIRAAREQAEAKGDAADATWYHEAVQGLRPFQPAVQARWALEGFMTKAPRRLEGKEGYYRTVFDCALLPTVKRNHSRWDLGDCTARSVLSWAALREMTGDTKTGREVERGQREFLLTSLHPETGLVYYKVDPAHQTYHYQIWDQSRTLRALVRWYETRPQDRTRIATLLERMIRGLERFATLRGVDPAWGPWLAWPSDEFTNDQAGEAFSPDMDNLREGLSIEPLVEYAALTKNPKILDLAIRYANCVMGGHAGDNVPADRRRVFQIAPDGSFRAHFHCKTTTLIGIVKLGRYLALHGRPDEAKRYLRRARTSYDWILAPFNLGRGSRLGWMPERPGSDIHETCCVADMTEFAEALASCAPLDPEFHDWANLHDDVEAMAVNVVARSQIHLTSAFQHRLAEFYEHNGANAKEQLAAAQVFDGLMPAVIHHSDLLWHRGDGDCLICGGCCMYSGVIALYTGWHDAMTFHDGQLRINYFLNRESPYATMTTRQPLDGEAQIVLRRPAEVVIRVPNWLRQEQLSIQVDGRVVTAARASDPTGHFLALGRLATGAKIGLRFPLEERVTIERFAGRRYRVLWRGNYVVQLGPREAKIPMLSTRSD
jgi:hypothetical protein